MLLDKMKHFSSSIIIWLLIFVDVIIVFQIAPKGWEMGIVWAF